MRADFELDRAFYFAYDLVGGGKSRCRQGRHGRVFGFSAFYDLSSYDHLLPALVFFEYLRLLRGCFCAHVALYMLGYLLLISEH